MEAVNGMANAMATQQYMQAQQQQQQAALEAAEKAEEKRKKESAELTSNILATVQAGQAENQKEMATALTGLAGMIAQNNQGNNQGSSSGYGSSSVGGGQTLKRRAPPTVGPRGKAKARPRAPPTVGVGSGSHCAAAGDPKFERFLPKRISDEQWEPLLEFPEVNLVPEDDVARDSVRALTEALDKQIFGSRADWERFYCDNVNDESITVPARWHRSAIILRCINLFYSGSA